MSEQSELRRQERCAARWARRIKAGKPARGAARKQRRAHLQKVA